MGKEIIAANAHSTAGNNQIGKRKVKTGCITCRSVYQPPWNPASGYLLPPSLKPFPRIRRVKCDEGKPNCLRCSTTGRKCEGFPVKSVTRTEICHVLRRDTTFRALLDVQFQNFENGQECRSFDHFRLMTAPKCGLFFGSDFWSRRVLQMSHSDAAIWHAVLALGALLLEEESADYSIKNKQRGCAFESYNKAIAHTSQLLSRSGRDNFEKGLVACILFTCYENLLGHYPLAQMHLQSGLRILSDGDGKTPRPSEIYRQEVPDDILHIFSRLDFQAMTLSESSSPYPYVNSFRRIREPGSIPLQFGSLAEAQHHLIEHTKWIFLLGEIMGATQRLDPQEFLLRKFRSDDRLSRWSTAFDYLLDRFRREGSWTDEKQHTSKLLQIYHAQIVALSDPAFLGCELPYDRYCSQFESMLDLLESLIPVTSSAHAIEGPLSKPLCSFEMGVVLPLYMIGTKCRDPRLRRRAIALLYSVNRREGLWDSWGAARVAETIMKIEEEGLGDVQRADQIGSDRRVSEVCVWINIERREIRLSCKIKFPRDRSCQVRNQLLHF